jgi:hypothetical protein
VKFERLSGDIADGDWQNHERLRVFIVGALGF